MAVLTNAKSKKCATCQFMNCTREPDSFKTSVRYESTAKGVCTKTKQTKAANNGGCPKWEKWALLK